MLSFPRHLKIEHSYFNITSLIRKEEHIGQMFEKYEDMLDRGEYENEEDLCNGEGINCDDLYKDDK